MTPSMPRLVSITLLLVGISVFSSCEELHIFPASPSDDQEEKPRSDAGINIFSTPELNTLSYFIRFESDSEFEDGRWISNRLEYLPDTLEVRLLNKSHDTYTLEEQYTKGSKTYLEHQHNPNFPLRASYQITFSEEGWIFEPAEGEDQAVSLLFGFFEPFELPEQRKGAFKDIQVWEEELELEILGNSYAPVTLSFNYGPMAYDGPGLEWYYTDAKELIRVGFIGAMIPKSSGWDWLPQ